MATTITKQLSVGDHRIRISCSGYDSYEATIRISSNGSIRCLSVISGSCSSSSRPGIAIIGNKVTVYMKTSSSGACPQPSAFFTTSPSRPKVGDRVTFSQSSSVAGSGATVQSRSWQYGDGGSGSSSYHTYSREGTYTVRLTITNSCGKTATTMQHVTIESSSGGTGGSTTKTVQFTIPNGASLTVLS